jgi:hypothetical protein
MPRRLVLALAFVVAAIAASPIAALTPAGAAPAKHVRHWHGYGFLPGYRPPEQVAREDAWLYWRRHPYWYGWPRFYRGRWNGGGFGPCWTQTPIGSVWNCGK